jgi:hypothetical protein
MKSILVLFIGFTLFLTMGLPLVVAQNSISFQEEVVLPSSPELDANAVFLAKDKKALQRLTDLEEAIDGMTRVGIKTVRISDGLIAAQAYYELERPLVAANKKENFTDTFKKVTEMEGIVDLAYEAKDEIVALTSHLAEVKGEIDTAPVEELLALAKREMREERFENVKATTAQGEDKIAELQSLDTKAKAAAEAATANLISFLDTNKFNIVGILIILIVLFVIFRNRLRHYLAKARIRALELEKETLKNEIRRAQTEFFVKGTLPESIYKIRIKVFNMMIRNITRKIAVAYEAQKRSEFIGFFKGPPAKKEPIIKASTDGKL